MPDVSVVILNFNGKECLKECLKSLQKQSYRDFEVIVSDNSSTDGSQEMVRKSFPKFRLLANDRNYGVSEGYNRGVAIAKGRYAATLANDMVLDRNWLKEAFAAFKDKKVAAAGSFIKNKDEGFYKGEKVFGFYMDLLGNPVTLHRETPGYIFGPSGAIFDRKKIPVPYDNDYFYSGDEIYIGWQALLKGYNTAQANKAKLFHIGRVSVNAGNVSAFVEFHGEKDRYLNLLVFYSAGSLLKIIPLIITNTLLTLATSIPRRRIHIRLKSYWWLMRNFPLVMKKRREMQQQRKAKENEIFRYITYRIPYNIAFVTPTINLLLYIYCCILRIPVMERQKR